MNGRYNGLNPFLAGWGKPREPLKFGSMVLWNFDMSPILLQIQLPVVPTDECKKNYQVIDEENIIQIDDRVICAGYAEGGKDSCQGDSGGPLMLPVHQNGSFPFYQIGIISWYKMENIKYFFH